MNTAQHPDEMLRSRVRAAYEPLLKPPDPPETADTADTGETAAQREAVEAFLEQRVAGEWSALARLLVEPAALAAPVGPTGTMPVSPVTDEALSGDDPRTAFYSDYQPGGPLHEPAAGQGESSPERTKAIDTAEVLAAIDPEPARPVDRTEAIDTAQVLAAIEGDAAARPADQTEALNTADVLAAAEQAHAGSVAEIPPPDPEDVVRAVLDTPPVGLVKAPTGAARTAVVAEIIRRLTASGSRVLLLGERTADVVAELAQAPVQTAAAGPPGPPGAEQIKQLRRELLWLEQWPRDRTALADVHAGAERRRTELTANEQRLTAEIETIRQQLAAGAERETAARERSEQLGADHERAAAAAAQARASWQELQTAADSAGREADENTKAAEDAAARHRRLAERITQCEHDLRAAKDREAELIEQLGQARDAIPRADQEIERLAATDAETTAAQHASYYRLAAAESALAAARRELTWGQRLHVAPAPPKIDDLRHQVKARAREADDAARQAVAATRAHEEAEHQRAALNKVIADGERELEAVRAAQERLAEEIAKSVPERDTAQAEHQRRTGETAAAVDRAAQAVAAARDAARRSAAAEEHGATARRAQEEAAAELAAVTAELTAARDRMAAVEAELAAHRDGLTATQAEIDAEIAAFTEAEQRSLGHVRRICGSEPDDAGITEHRTRSMARIEELAAELEAANVVHGTVGEFAAGPYAPGAEFDALVLLDADRHTDAELLVGAVRARRWILVGEADSPLGDQQRSAFERCALAAPSRCHEVAGNTTAGISAEDQESR
jgi:hypothetical protein